MEAGITANSVEERKRRKYAALAEAHRFEPIAVETMGVYGESTGVIMRAIGRRLVEATGEPGRLTGSVKTWLLLFSEAMRSVFSQPVGRGFRGSGEPSSTQPLTSVLREFPLP